MYKYDLFVSYAHVDDEAFPSINHGWVSNLFLALYSKLQVKRGAVSVVSRWQAVRTVTTALTPTAVTEQLQQSAVLLIISSPGYWKSEECQQERQIFLRQDDPNSPSEQRILIVEKQPSKHQDIPELEHNQPYRFWYKDERGRVRTLAVPQPQADDLRYYNEIQDLANHLVTMLDQLPGVEPPVAPVATVYLTEVSDVLREERMSVQRYLEQHNIRVLPGRAGFQKDTKTLDRYLTEADFFVLLGDVDSENPENRGSAQRQEQQARARGLRIMHWRAPASLEEFKAELLQRITIPLPSKSSEQFVFLNANEDDSGLARMIGRVVGQLGLSWHLRAAQGRPAEVREALTAELSNCEALIVIYGEVNPEWVEQQWTLYSRIERTTPAKALALYLGPPEDKPQMKPAIEVQVLDCRHGLDEVLLRQFLAPLLAGDAA